MSTEENKAIVRRSFQYLDQHHTDSAAQHFTPDWQVHGFGPQPVEVSEWQQAIGAFVSGFPDARFTIEDMIAEGEKVATRHPFHGMHRGEFQGIAPTGKPVRINAILITRIVDGKVKEDWLNGDFMGLMQQFGIVPQPGS